jgi:hypothetical protein
MLPSRVAKRLPIRATDVGSAPCTSSMLRLRPAWNMTFSLSAESRGECVWTCLRGLRARKSSRAVCLFVVCFEGVFMVLGEMSPSTRREVDFVGLL